MQPDDVQLFLANPPSKISISSVTEHDRLEERVSIINVVFANIIGVNVDSLEWCPNYEPPSRDETLGWLWVSRPDLADEIEARTSDEFFLRVMRRYRVRLNERPSTDNPWEFERY